MMKRVLAAFIAAALAWPAAAQTYPAPKFFTPAPSSNDNSAATTAFVVTAIGSLAPVNNPVFTGVLTVPQVASPAGSNLTLAAGSASGGGGNVVIKGGTGTLGVGGNITLSPGGSAGNVAPYGNTSVTGNTISLTSTAGGNLTLSASQALLSAASGVPVNVTGGAGNSLLPGGNVVITPGASGGAGAGSIILAGPATATTLSSSGVASLHGIGMNGNIPNSGGLVAANSWLFAQPFYFGSNTGTTGAENYIGISDQVNYSGANAMSGFEVALSGGGANFAGNRNGIMGQVGLQSAPNPGDASLRNYVGVYGASFATVSLGGSVGAISPTSYKGGIWGGWSYPRLSGAGTVAQSIIGHEIDTLMGAGSSAALNWGLVIVNETTGNVRADYSSVGLLIGGYGGASTIASSGFKTAISVGDTTGDSATTTDSTVLAAPMRLYGIAGAAVSPQFLYGVDFRGGQITTGGAAFASPNFAVGPLGALYARGITTDSVVQAQTATLTGITINNAGVYATIPTIAVQAPPSGGTTAVVTVATVGGIASGPTGFLAFGATGKNYVVGDVLTYPLGIGAKPTFTVSSVNASGGITGVTVTTNGALTSAAANPIYPTGGTGTGAAFNFSYTQSGNTFVPAVPTFAATGSDYVGGIDIITVVGDTGPAVKYAVATVDSFGGILTATVNTVGSLTTLAGGTYRTVTSTGAGVNASIQPGYQILTFSIGGAGSGYLPNPLPLITTSTSTWRVADLVAVMTAAAAPLALNPSGGLVQAGGMNVGRFVSVPATSGATCATGDFAADASFIYACRATNTWVRSAAATW